MPPITLCTMLSFLRLYLSIEEISIICFIFGGSQQIRYESILPCRHLASQFYTDWRANLYCCNCKNLCGFCLCLLAFCPSHGGRGLKLAWHWECCTVANFNFAKSAGKGFASLKNHLLEH